MASAFILVYHQFLTSFGLLQAQIEQVWHRSFRKVWLLIMASTVSEREISTDASKSRDQEYKIVVSHINTCYNSKTLCQRKY